MLGMAAPKLTSAAEYFAIDDSSEQRHELVDGVVWAMSGGTPEHSRVTINLGAALRTRLRGKPCRPYSSDLRVALTYQAFAYPDLTIVCGPLETLPDNDLTVTNPAVVFEVLSASTERYDRGRKLHLYTNLESMLAVVLVTPDKPLVEVYEKVGQEWIWTIYRGCDAVMMVKALSLEIPLIDLYED
jgi:Uma2 family endonuclease